MTQEVRRAILATPRDPLLTLALGMFAHGAQKLLDWSGGPGIALTLAGAALIVHLPNGFFMNWSGTSPGEGFEYHVLAVALAALVAVRGSGAFSVDRALS
ncbi:hypothetical protein [Amycolatopsis magusensis]|uniref:hypothetical protein n=1 Tax=Amycolatopsis magusensis TaxID=882444 RepID=UPI003C304C7E